MMEYLAGRIVLIRLRATGSIVCWEMREKCPCMLLPLFKNVKREGRTLSINILKTWKFMVLPNIIPASEIAIQGPGRICAVNPDK